MIFIPNLRLGMFNRTGCVTSDRARKLSVPTLNSQSPFIYDLDEWEPDANYPDESKLFS